MSITASSSPLAVTAKARARAMDRALLYLRGLNLAPETVLELASESLRRADRGPDGLTAARLMAELSALLRERQIHPEQYNEAGPHLRCAPPLDKRSMVAEELDTALLTRLFRRCAVPVSNPAKRNP